MKEPLPSKMLPNGDLHVGCLIVAEEEAHLARFFLFGEGNSGMGSAGRFLDEPALWLEKPFPALR